mmetsp:Transcript_117137/g.364765  ORF Transcript_117137/g.364765 Transcript_117137/m.364765 type:complete len:246 (+) Transcript_117137:1535-2272(+)
MQVVPEDVERLLGRVHRILDAAILEAVGGDGVELEGLLLPQLQLLVERLRLLRRPQGALDRAGRRARAGRHVHGVGLALGLPEVPEDGQRLVAGRLGLLRLLLALQDQRGDENLGSRNHLLLTLSLEGLESLAGGGQSLVQGVGPGQLRLRLGHGERHLRLPQLVGALVALHGLLGQLQGLGVLAPAAERVHVEPLRVGRTLLLARLLEHGNRILGRLRGLGEVLRRHVPLRQRDQRGSLLLLAA